MHCRRSLLKSFIVLTLSLLLGWVVGATPCHAKHWVDVRVAGPFVVRADFPLIGFETLLTELARLQTDLNRSLGIQPPKERIELYLLSDERTYRAFLKRHFPEVPYRRALFHKNHGPCRVMVFRNPEFKIDIRHECTHALLHSTLPMVPLWLDEGLAEYFEQPPNQRVYDHPHFKNLKWRVRLGMVTSIKKLERKNFSNLDSAGYRDSWAWVHFMLHGSPEARHELIRYLDDIESSTPSKRFSQRLAQHVPDARSQMARHFSRWKRPAQGPLARQPNRTDQR